MDRTTPDGCSFLVGLCEIACAINSIVLRTPLVRNGRRDKLTDTCCRSQLGLAGCRREVKVGNSMEIGVLHCIQYPVAEHQVKATRSRDMNTSTGMDRHTHPVELVGLWYLMK